MPERTPNSRTFRDFEEDGWNRNATDYAAAFGRATEPFIEPLLDATQVTSETKLLDLACGPGSLAAVAAIRGADVVGVDISEKMVAVARQRNPDIPFHRAAAEDLPFPDSSFDAVCSGFAMHHFPDPGEAAAEVLRVLRPGGAFSFTIWSGDAGKDSFFNLVSEAVERHGTLNASLPEGPENFALADRTRCETLLTEAGFEGTQRSEITVDLDLPGPESILDILATTVRMRAIVEAQTEGAQRLIRADLIEASQRFERFGSVRLPMTGVLVSARGRVGQSAHRGRQD